MVYADEWQCFGRLESEIDNRTVSVARVGSKRPLLGGNPRSLLAQEEEGDGMSRGQQIESTALGNLYWLRVLQGVQKAVENNEHCPMRKEKSTTDCSMIDGRR